MTITAEVANASPDLSADQASVALNLPAGVELVSGSRTQQLGSLSKQGEAGNVSTASWVVRATEDGVYNLTATTDAEHCGEQFGDQGSTVVAVATPQQSSGGGGAPGGPVPGTQPTPMSPSSGPRPLASPHLRVRKGWSREGLRILGTLSRGASGHVTVKYSGSMHGRRTQIVKRVTVRRGRFAVLVHLGRRGRGTVTVTYQGDRSHRREAVRVTVR